ncbi:MAG TPA: PepSY domain-containing protein [Candidatus Baltobacteraceae bacterium]|nr:PepSY domain-containing protein [Candidatus Baltobacteraceae bacterium]
MNSMMFAAVLAVSIFASASAATSVPLKGAQYLPQTKISLARARSIALAKERGTILDQELEREATGSGLRYSFDIKIGAVVHEVGVDAVTGRVLEDTIDNGND